VSNVLRTTEVLISKKSFPEQRLAVAARRMQFGMNWLQVGQWEAIGIAKKGRTTFAHYRGGCATIPQLPLLTG
jgi:hypothetical protein